MRVVRFGFWVVAAALLAAPAAGGVPEWWEVDGPADAEAEVFGGYSRGCVAGALALPADGAGYQVMRPSRDRAYGHPALVRFIETLAAKMQVHGWPGLLVGDLAQPRGGPMRTGHASHQTGLDADIWFRPAPERRLSRAERDDLPAISMLGADGESTDPEHWQAGHVTLLRTAAEAPEVARIFVHPAIKQTLCDTVRGDRQWLRKIRPWWGHHYHFHVRLRCRPSESACVDQAPPPAGDGCDASLAWWFSEEARAKLEERRKQPPKPRLTLADLPPQCRGVLTGP